MTIDSSPNFYDEPQESPATSIACAACGSAGNIHVESLDFAGPRLLGRLAIKYSCNHCGALHAHDSTAMDVARFLAEQPDPLPVAHLGGHYIHCGEPMEAGNLELTAVKVNDGDLAKVPAVELESTVLRCQCGFQMAVPAVGGC